MQSVSRGGGTIYKLGFIGLGVALLTVVLAAGPNPMIPFPPNFRQTLVKYAVVDRIDGKTRDLYISKRGLEAVQQGLPLPVGTVVAIEAFNGLGLGPDNRMLRTGEANQLHVITKLQPGEGLRVWGFGAYELSGKPEGVLLEMPGNCLVCHQSAEKTDLVFTMPLLKRFAATGEVQFNRCNLSGRDICDFK